MNGLAGAGGGIVAQLLTYPLQAVRFRSLECFEFPKFCCYSYMNRFPRYVCHVNTHAMPNHRGLGQLSRFCSTWIAHKTP